ncbi:MAG: hypothetical protein RLZZ475_1654 [Pseudomonadota bacterium]
MLDKADEFIVQTNIVALRCKAITRNSLLNRVEVFGKIDTFVAPSKTLNRPKNPSDLFTKKKRQCYHSRGPNCFPCEFRNVRVQIGYLLEPTGNG